jgi:hypothetical protein
MCEYLQGGESCQRNYANQNPKQLAAEATG